MSKATKLLSMALCVWSVISQLSAGQFVEEPQTANVTAGSEVVFTCRHSPDPDIYGWTINGVSATSGNISEIIMPMVAHNRLTILAIPEYNGSVIECVAVFLDGTPTQTSSPAILIVQDAAGDCNYTNGTLAIAFDLEPKSRNVVEDDIAEFQCYHTKANYTGFTLNGTSSNNFTQNVSTESLVLDGPGTGSVLIVGAIPVYHGTIVVCVAIIDDCPSQGSREAILLIQGPLQAVTKLRRGYIGGDFQRYSWDPPPTIDLTDVEPDIAYCISVHNITCGRNDLVISECNIVDTFYGSQLIHPHRVYSVEVIPRSNVESARNGTPLSANETFMDMDIELSSTRFEKNDNFDNLTVALKVDSNVMVAGNVIVPEQFTVTVTAIDGADKEPMKMSRVVQGQVRNITFSLPSRRLWEYDFLAYGCEEHLLGSVIISTHEIQNITYTLHAGNIGVTGQFINGLAINRTLVIVYSRTNESDVHYNFGKVVDHSFLTEVGGLKGGTYGIAVFVEENGTVFPRAAARPLSVNYTSEGSNDISSEQINYTILSNSTGVYITCIFLESSTATDCVAVVHQRISQLNSSAGLMNIESSHKFTRSGDTRTVSGCIKGVNLTKSQVGVVGGQRVTGTDINTASSNVGVIVGISIGSAVGLLLMIKAIFLLITLILWNRKRKNEAHLDHTVGGQEQINEYEQTQNVRNGYRANVPPAIAGSFQTHEGRALLSDTDGDRPATDKSQPQGPPQPHTQRPRGRYTPLSRSSNPSHDTGSSRDLGAAQLNDATTQPADHQVQQNPVLDTSPNGSVAISDNLRNAVYTQGPPLRSGPEAESIPDGDALFRDTSSSGPGTDHYTLPDMLHATPAIPRSPAADKVVYDEIDKFQNPQGQQYSMAAALPASMDTPDEFGKIHDGDVRPPTATQTTVSLETVVKQETTRENPDPTSVASGDSDNNLLNLEQLIDHLLPKASIWKDLGAALSLDEDILDEIYTNNDTDEDCLRDMLERYMRRSDLKHNWEEVDAALRKMRDVATSLSVQEERALSVSNGEVDSLEITAVAVPVTENAESDEKEYRKVIKSHMKSDVKNPDASKKVVTNIKPRMETTQGAPTRAKARGYPLGNLGESVGAEFDQNTAERFQNKHPEHEYRDDSLELSPGEQSIT